MSDPRLTLVRAAARDVVDRFEAFSRERGDITRRARARFEARDWAGGQRDARRRLDLRDHALHETVGVCRAELGGAARDREVWLALRERYDAEVESRPDAEIARSFFNSVSRRVLGTVGVAAGIEFLEGPRPGLGTPRLRRFPREPTTEALLRRVLEAYAFAAPYQDLARDVRIAAVELDAHLRELPDAQPVEAMEVAEPVFFRGKGAYLVGRLRRGRQTTPLVPGAGTRAGRGGARRRPLHRGRRQHRVQLHALVLPRRRGRARTTLVAFLELDHAAQALAELYIALGYDKHGKTELYRGPGRHLASSTDALRARARRPRHGDGRVHAARPRRGLQGDPRPLRAIRSRPPGARCSSATELVFRHDRAGRLVDAQEFEHLAFPRDRFGRELLAELRAECRRHGEPSTATASSSGTSTPSAASPRSTCTCARRTPDARPGAVLDFGQAIATSPPPTSSPATSCSRTSASRATGGSSSTTTTSLAPLTDCNFRDMPGPRTEDEEMAAEPWFYVGQHDMFPEEFLPFLGLHGRLRETFLQAHGELFGARCLAPACRSGCTARRDRGHLPVP